jgi:hypothetical protein
MPGSLSERNDLPTDWGRWGERDERGTLSGVPVNQLAIF